MNEPVCLPPDAIDADRAAEILDGSRSLVYRMLRDGRLRGWKVGGTRVRVSESEVRALIAPVTIEQPEGPRTPRMTEAAAEAALARLRAQGYRV